MVRQELDVVRRELDVVRRGISAHGWGPRVTCFDELARGPVGHGDLGQSLSARATTDCSPEETQTEPTNHG